MWDVPEGKRTEPEPLPASLYCGRADVRGGRGDTTGALYSPSFNVNTFSLSTPQQSPGVLADMATDITKGVEQISVGKEEMTVGSRGQLVRRARLRRTCVPRRILHQVLSG